MVIVALLSTNLGTVEPIVAPPTGDIQVGGRSANFPAVAAKNDWVLGFLIIYLAVPPVHSFLDVERVVSKQLFWGAVDCLVPAKLFRHGQKSDYGVHLKLLR